MRASLRLARHLKPYWLWAVLAPALMVLEVAMDLWQPRLVATIMDEGIARGDMQVVLATGLQMTIVAAIGMVGGVGCTIFAIMAGQYFGADLRGALFAKVQALSFGNLDRLETGGVINRLTNDVTQVTELVMIMLRVMVRVPMLLVGSLALGIITSPQLSVIFAVLIPLILALLIAVIRRTFPMFGEVQHRLDALNTVLQENLAGVRVIKAFARARHEIARFAAANNLLMDQNISAVRVSAVTMPTMMLLANIGLIAAVWLGGARVAGGGMQVGQLVAFVNYLVQTLFALMMVSMLVMRIARAAASSERIEEVLNNRPDVPPNSAARQSFSPVGRLDFENVSFSYGASGVDTRDEVLRDVTFSVQAGQTIAVLGATGSGKSSLVNLIPRFYEVTSGRVTIDGIDVRDIDEHALRGAIGVALQESVLFSGSISDNIRFGLPDAGDAEVIAAAKMAQAHGFISGFPDGYDAVVGQRGVNLSGGQKQRIAIARALLPQPALLILDDSTSAVDIETEAAIQAALDALPRQPTRVIVAQRISSVLRADKIIVLDDGRISAQGKHAELLAGSPIYREIYESQLGGGVVARG